MGTKTTLVKPNYTYAGGPARTVRQDSMFASPALNLGAPRRALDVPTEVSGAMSMYGRNGTERPGASYFFKPTGPAPVVNQDGGDNGEPLPNPSGDPAAMQQQPAQAQFQGKYNSDPGPVRKQAVAAQPQRQAPAQSMMAMDQGDGWEGGLAALGQSVYDAKTAANDQLTAAKGGQAPGAADSSWTGRMRDKMTSMFGGPSRANIEDAYGQAKLRPGGYLGPGQGGGYDPMTMRTQAQAPMSDLMTRRPSMFR